MTEQAGNETPEQAKKTEAELAAEIAAEARSDADDAEDMAEELAEEAEAVGIEEAEQIFAEADKDYEKAKKALAKAKEKVSQAADAQVAAGKVLESLKPKSTFSESIQAHLKSQNDKARKATVKHPIDIAGSGGPSPFQR